MFSYGQLEAAIRSLHDVPPERAGTFKARIRHFQRIGLVPSSPGKGIKIEYEVADAWKWAICFELAEAGLMPEAIKSILGAAGRKLTISSAGAGHPAEDQIFWLRAEFLSWHLDHLPDWYDNKVRLNVVPVSRVADVAFKQEGAGRVLMLNLTKLKRDLFTALKIDWD
jgi:hypothetical protein